MVDQKAESFVLRQTLGESGFGSSAHEPADRFSVIDIREFRIRAVTYRFFGVSTATARTATDLILL